jgi:hypothetical protein
MKKPQPPLLQWAIVAAALLRGLGEFLSLQRWRIQAWLARHWRGAQRREVCVRRSKP